MNKTLHVIAMLLIAFSAMGAVPKSVVIHTTYGEKAYSIGNIRKLTFDSSADGSLKIYPKDGTSALTYSYTYFVKGTFSGSSGVEELNLTDKNTEVVYNSAQQTITITSSEIINSVQVYDLRGSLVLAVSPSNNDAEVSVVSMQSGLYVVKVATATGVVTQKIVKR